MTLLRVTECTNVSETPLSKFTLVVNHRPGQLAAAGGQVVPSEPRPQSRGAETRDLGDERRLSGPTSTGAYWGLF